MRTYVRELAATHVRGRAALFIPAVFLEARHAVVLGGTKYAQFEVEPGMPLHDRAELDCAA